jgi:predicted acetyltransferase
MAVQLIVPTRDTLPGYVAALERGWSPDNTRGDAARRDELMAIRSDADDFVARQVDREARGGPVTMPDGSTVPRLPGYRLWIWDGEFCGAIGLRWQPGTSELPAYVLGHIGYAVVPWKQGKGYGKRALALMLARARHEGLDYVEVTTDPENVSSRRVIEANGGLLLGEFTKPPQFGSKPGLRFRIPLPCNLQGN